MLNKFLRNLKILGTQFRNNSFRELCSFVKDALFKVEKNFIYAMDLDDSIKNMTLECEFVEQISRGDLEELARFRGRINNPRWEFCCDIYDGVQDFFIFQDNSGYIGHISWIYYKENPNRLIKLSFDEAEIKCALTVDKYRGKGIYPATLMKILSFLRTRGFKRAYISVNVNNVPSIKGIEKAGFSLKTKTRLIKVMGFQLNRKMMLNGGRL